MTSAEPAPGQRDAVGVWWWSVALAVFWGLAVTRRPVLLNHDVASILQTTARVIEGERLYVDIPEPNPPLVFVAAGVPVILSGALSLDVRHLAFTLLVSLTLTCWALVARALTVLGLPDSRSTAVLACALLPIMLCVPGYDFGQREPMFFILMLPWLIGRVGVSLDRALPGWMRVVVAFLAAAGMALKPYLPLLWLVCEAWIAWRRRSLRSLASVENAVVAGALVTYGLFVLGATEWRENLAIWREWARPSSPTGFPAELAIVVLQPWVVLGALSGAVVVQARGAGGPSLGAVQVVCWFTMGVALLGFVLQGKWFTYHAAPVVMAAWMLAAWTGAELSTRSLRARRATLGGAALLAALSFHGRAWILGGSPLGVAYPCEPQPARRVPGADGRCEISGIVTFVGDVVDSGDRIAWLSTESMVAAQVTTSLGLIDVRRMPQILLPSLYTDVAPKGGPFPYHAAASRSDLEQRVLLSLFDDVIRGQPRLIAFDCRRDVFGFPPASGFDFVEFYRQDPRMAALLDEGYVEVPDTVADGTMRWFLRRDTAR